MRNSYNFILDLFLESFNTWLSKLGNYENMREILVKNLIELFRSADNRFLISCSRREACVVFHSKLKLTGASPLVDSVLQNRFCFEHTNK